MKTKTKYLTALVAFTILLSAFRIADLPIGPHDGVVKPAGVYNIEVKNSFPNLYAFLLNKSYQPIPNKDITCEARFALSDSTSVIIPMKPFEEDGFIMDVNSLKYNSCRVSFIVFGRRVSAQFENESLIADKTIN